MTTQQNITNMDESARLAAEQRRDELVQSLYQSVTGTFKTFSVYIGFKLGFYDALAQHGTMTPGELADATGTHERYVREWLEQQTVAGVLEVEDHQAEAHERCFSLPKGHDEVLTDRDSLNYFTPIVQLGVSVTRPLEALLHVYRNGGGVRLHEYGEDFLHGQGGANRATFLQDLGQVWLPAIPDLHKRLQANPPAKVADFGCGVGWSSIGMALAYPNIQVDGFDLDEPSIREARKNAAASKLDGRVNFHARDAGDPALQGEYDLVTAFECVHDMSDPISALRTMRRLAKQQGTVLVVDERVGDTFTPTGNEIEEIMYGWSILHCLPVGMVDQPSQATGTVMRADTLRKYARKAGFKEVEVLPIDNFFFRVYRLML